MTASGIQSSSERELVAGFAFLVKATPDALVAEGLRDLLDRVDPNTLAYAVLPPAPSLADFAFLAHDVPAVALTHVLFVPDGDAWVAVHRQFYGSASYNSEQAIGALLPVKDGTIVTYLNHTSTDQVMGLGGSVKRSIGSKLLASQLEALYQKAAAAVTKGG